MLALVTRLHDVKISFFAIEIKGIYLNKRIEKKKKNGDIFVNVFYVFTETQRKKKKSKYS